jgi:hypothetical protein
MRQQISGFLLSNLVAIVSCSPSLSGGSVPPLETIVARMAEARAENRHHFRAYTVTRDYQLFGKERALTKSQVMAEVTFIPPDSKKYTLQQTSGVGLGRRIVRRILETEVQIAKDCSSTEISPDNYEFHFVREETLGHKQCYVLALTPKREDKNLVRGNIWVDTETYLLHRVEGEPSKPASWWLRDVRMVLLYGDVDGMWLQTASEGTANVKFLGQHTMVARDVKYSINELVAAESSSQKRSLRGKPFLEGQHRRTEESNGTQH